MAHRPDPRLMAMPHPYDYEARIANGVPYLWDASYFNGRYYLYFSPLPVLMVYIPYGLVASRALRVAAIAVALTSGLLGAMLGFNASSGAFEYFNPELFGRLSRLFE